MVEAIVETLACVRQSSLLKRLLESRELSITLQLACVLMEEAFIETMPDLIERASESGILRDDVPQEMISDWLRRNLLSLLMTPPVFAHSPQEQRLLLEKMLVPVLVAR